MPEYDFKILSSFDFENLTRDLLQRKLRIDFESFKSGADSGIDFRYSKSSGDIILQCKHYSNSSFSTLQSSLKKEINKVRKLNPKRYILITSLGLTPKNKQIILDVFHPYLKNFNDILGKDDLNNFLGQYSDLEIKHHKLWISSSTVLKRVLHSKIYNQTEAEIDRIHSRLKFYVQNKNFEIAFNILESNKFCIISGAPGVGKTTLAEVLFIKYIAKGYCPVFISSNIDEAMELFEKNEKQVFYYDDFLGQTSLDEGLVKNEDKKIIKFLTKVRENKNKVFILTTREYILNQAKQKYEVLKRENIDFSKYLVELQNYTKVDKSKILLNHLEFSSLPIDYKKSILHNNNFLEIIKHPNYSPRIISWMTNSFRSNEINLKNYFKAFVNHLNNPEILWKCALEEHISMGSRCLLIVLSSFSTDVEFNQLEESFQKYFDFHSKAYNYEKTTNSFHKAIQECEENFVHLRKKSEKTYVSFHNPSIRDFLENFLLDNSSDTTLLIESICFFEQCSGLWKGELKKSLANNSLYLNKLKSTYKKNHFIKSFYARQKGLNFYFEVSNLETRISFLILISTSIAKSDFDLIIDDSITFLISCVNKEECNKEKLMSLLKEIAESTYKNNTLIEQLLISFKEFLKKNLDSIEDFITYIDLQQHYKILVKNFSRDFNTPFQDMINSDVGFYQEVDDPEEIFLYIRQIKIVSNAIQSDCSEIIEYLEYLATTKNEEEKDDEEYNINHKISLPQAEISDEEVIQMFNGLCL